MARVCVSVLLLVGLTSAYVIHPVAGWVSLASLFVALVRQRLRKADLSPAAVTQAH